MPIHGHQSLARTSRTPQRDIGRARCRISINRTRGAPTYLFKHSQETGINYHDTMASSSATVRYARREGTLEPLQSID